jgi:hypothetical protein
MAHTSHLRVSHVFFYNSTFTNIVFQSIKMSNTKYYRLSDSSDGEKGDLEPVVSENGGLSKRNTIFMGAILTGLMVITASLGFLAGRGFTKPSGYKIDRWNCMWQS